MKLHKYGGSKNMHIRFWMRRLGPGCVRRSLDAPGRNYAVYSEDLTTERRYVIVIFVNHLDSKQWLMARM